MLMSTTLNSEQRIQSLDEDILRVESLQDSYRSDLSALSEDIKRLQLWWRYFRFVTWFRSPVAKFDLWPVGVMLCGPLLVATVLFAVSLLVINSLSIALWSGGFGAVVGLLACSISLYYPKNETLRASLSETEGLLKQNREKETSFKDKYDTVTSSLQSLQANRTKLAASIRFQREQLLKQNWKAMRGDELDNYLATVCKVLGYSVTRTGRSGDQGVDLVIQRDSLRIAIQIKGYLNSVSNDAVQQVVAGKKVYKCNRCAVITNSKFTPSAIELAKINRCSLISEESFENFVLGNIKLE